MLCLINLISQLPEQTHLINRTSSVWFFPPFPLTVRKKILPEFACVLVFDSPNSKVISSTFFLANSITFNLTFGKWIYLINFDTTKRGPLKFCIYHVVTYRDQMHKMKSQFPLRKSYLVLVMELIFHYFMKFSWNYCSFWGKLQNHWYIWGRIVSDKPLV